MKSLLVAGLIVVVCAAVSQSAWAQGDCYTVRGEADARNRQISTERAVQRLHRHIADAMRSPGGHTVGPTSTHCIRNACEASAIVCRH